jgi:glycine cleavage system regulatory protein
MNISIVLTVIADDKPGVIQTVSRVLKQHDGSWTQSSMSSLAGQFAGILLASVPKERSEACIEELHGLESVGLRIIAHATGGESISKPTNEYFLELVGNDRPGIVHDMTRVLASHRVNVHNLETLVEPASMGGGELFRANAHLLIPDNTDIEALEDDLEEMANDLMVDISFES